MRKFEEDMKRHTRNFQLMLLGFLVLGAVLVGYGIYSMPSCGVGEVLVRGAWQLVCVKGHQ